MKKYTVAIIGVGNRGGDVYGRLFMQFPEQFKIVSLCDAKEDRLSLFGDEFGVDPSLRFLSEEAFFTEKRADLCVIATQDRDHVRHALAAFRLGYDIMTEKPLSDIATECEELLAAQKKYGGKALVCHVLRYAPAFVKMNELLKSGAIGRLVSIDATERVAYWHQAHSYVRGNWRNRESSTPMILAKCCHDLDLLQYYAGARCKSISSVGDLTFFKKENAPEGAAARCVDCPHKNTCTYSATSFYLDKWAEEGKPTDCWPYTVLAPVPVREDALVEAVKSGPYGRCVYFCDNNVVDHQITQMTFENGVKATLTMMGFTSVMGRRITFYGTMGEMTLDEKEHAIIVERFGEEPERIDTKIIEDNGYGHGGGDLCLVEGLYDMLEGKATAETSLERSVESHLMGIYAEESRLAGGKLFYVHGEN